MRARMALGVLTDDRFTALQAYSDQRPVCHLVVRWECEGGVEHGILLGLALFGMLKTQVMVASLECLCVNGS